MQFDLTSDMHVAFCRDRAIVLDVAADRYLRLGREISAGLRTNLHGREKAGTYGSATEMAVVGAPPALRIREIATHGWWHLVVRAELRAFGLKGTLARARQRRDRADDLVPDLAAVHARAFARSRALYPATPKCLPDALALHGLLCSRGIRCDFVIGVRDGPFAAHAWVEASPYLLTDTLDMIAELTPILRI